VPAGLVVDVPSALRSCAYLPHHALFSRALHAIPRCLDLRNRRAAAAAAAAALRRTCPVPLWLTDARSLLLLHFSGCRNRCFALLCRNTSALISPLVASSKKRKAAGGLGGALAHRPASALRKKSKYSPSNKEYLRRIEATRSDPSDDDEQSSSSSSPASASGGGGGASGVSGSAAAAAAHKASPAINFSPFNRVNLIPAKEEYDEYKADFDPDVKTLF
jgi:hypothetical protein